MSELITWIIFGAIAGWIASLIAGTNQSQGAVGNIIIGIAGAIIGGFVARNLGGQGVSGFNLMSFIVAIGGAVLLLAAVKMFTRAH
jgi:uncharacterized membrane protein YeaQ/YmgE (transglycosylase-associated protein family)